MSTSVTLDEFLNRDGDHINQVVYKVDGNFNGNITGDNVTVILMGDGDINGNINARDGEIVLIRGDVNGSVKANKVICPTKPTTEDKDQYICKSCYHYVQTPTGSYCTESSALGEALPVGSRVCKSYDGTGETTRYKSDCARFSNRSGICHCFHVNTCAIKHNCPYKIKREECKTENSTIKHNPAKDVKSPELPTKNIHKTCFDCSHLRFGLDMGVMVCNVTNESSYRLTPCENFERRCK